MVSCERGFKVEVSSFIENRGSMKKIDKIDKIRKKRPVVLRK
jgi:hypothetical protein